jgi:NADH dehydrogenase/NADH:ubiquinone oxidoreductase subunit G
MTLSPIRRVLLILLVLAFTCQPLLSQESAKERAAETSSTVPALKEFHAVIFKIWHTAWPKKDCDMLTALLPEIEQGIAAVAHAELPGILREKKAAWRNGVEKLQTIVKEYEAAIEAKQKQPLLDAAEKLHAQYEALVRVIRAPLRELDDFHAVLYMLYHYYLQEDSLQEVKVSIGQLQEKMAALNKATLPSRFKGKEESFTMARNQLDKAVTELTAMVCSNEFGKIKAAVEVMHTSYKTLAKVFE